MPDEDKPQEREGGEKADRGKESASSDAEQELDFDKLAETAEAKFTILVSSIATQVLVSLGQIENPLTKRKDVDLRGAKFSIDLLQLLADKTRGNLSDVEKRYLEGVLYRLRMSYVEAAKGA
jgi:hypothetical protein